MLHCGCGLSSHVNLLPVASSSFYFFGNEAVMEETKNVGLKVSAATQAVRGVC
jgi:hypothetical protein